MLETANIHRLLSAIVLVVCVCAGCGGQVDEPVPVLRFSGIPDQNTTELAARFLPLSDYLARELGVVVEYVPTRDYQATVETFRNGDILLGWFGGLTGLQARAAVDGSSVIAQGDIDREYYSYFIANKRTGLGAAPTTSSTTSSPRRSSITACRVNSDHRITDDRSGASPRAERRYVLAQWRFVDFS